MMMINNEEVIKISVRYFLHSEIKKKKTMHKSRFCNAVNISKEDFLKVYLGHIEILKSRSTQF